MAISFCWSKYSRRFSLASFAICFLSSGYCSLENSLSSCLGNFSIGFVLQIGYCVYGFH